MSSAVKVFAVLFFGVGLLVGGAFAVRSMRPKPQAAVKIVADDFSPPPIRALPSSEEQAQAWLRSPEAWPVEPLVREDLFGLRKMWLEGFAAACKAADVPLQTTYVAMLGAARDWVPQDTGCRDKLKDAAVPSKDAAHAYVKALYAGSKLTGVWFDAVRPAAESETFVLRAFHQGKRYSLPAQGPNDPTAVQNLLNTLSSKNG